MTLLFLLITGLYVYKTFRLNLIYYFLNKTISGAHSPDYTLFKYFPGVLILPIIFSIAAVLFFYCALKLRDKSPLGWLLSICITLSVPFSLWLVAKNTIDQTGFMRVDEVYSEPTILFGLILFFMLIAKKKKFTTEGKPIKTKYRIIILVFLLLITLPLTIYTIVATYVINTTDYDLKKIMSQVVYRVVTPQYIPAGRVYDSKYYISKLSLINGEKTIQLQLNYPLPDLLNGKKSGLVLMQQSSINKNFSMERFLKNETASGSAKKIEIPLASDNKATYFEKGIEKKILFTSRYNTLIRIKGYYIDETDIRKFAAYLR